MLTASLTGFFDEDSCDCAGTDELYINALHASEECDRLISIREERS